MDKLKQKVQSRRAQLDKKIAKGRVICDKPELSDTEADLLEATIEIVTTILEVIEGIHEKILDKLLGTEDYGTVFEESDDYVIRINEDIKETNVDTSLSVASGAAVSTTSFTSHKPKTVNLPKLQLITFEGDILRWQSFINSFEAAIDKNSALENIQKFQCLRAQLKGEAALVIEGLPLTSDNYTNAMEILKERYGQQHKLRNAYMKALWSLPSPTETISSLQTFHDNVETTTMSGTAGYRTPRINIRGTPDSHHYRETTRGTSEEYF
ncbi:uncharacterized protein LOC135495263 [Lineus longissimus]|uniref:uncharacterized protein LOC135495263 n=1 Tax=Lineus longissimus TaxID=88925 RepID=UPI00315D9DE4